MNVWDATKSGIAVVGVCLVLFGAYKVNAMFSGRDELMKALLANNAKVTDSFIKLADNIASREVVVNTKALELQLKDVDEKIIALAKERDEVITQLGKTVITLNDSVKLRLASDKSYLKGKVTDYEFIKIYSKDTEGEEYLVAWAMYHPNQVEGKRWKVGTYPLEVHERITYSENEKTEHATVEAWLENNRQKEMKGKKFPVAVKSVEWYKRTPTEKFQWFNPRLSIGMLGTLDDLYPTVNLSWASYGWSKRDMRWRFLPMGIGGNSENGFVQVSPFEYNIGYHLPIINNLFLGPYINWNFNDWKTSYGLGISVPF